MIVFDVPWPPPWKGKPLPFSVNRKRAAVVDLTGVQFLYDEVDTPIHPSVEQHQAAEVYAMTWQTPMWYMDWMWT